MSLRDEHWMPPGSSEEAAGRGGLDVDGVKRSASAA
jgi:hypothetical protein